MKKLSDILEVVRIPPEETPNDPGVKLAWAMNSGKPFSPNALGKKYGTVHKKIGELDTGHHVYHMHDEKSDTHFFYAHEPKSKEAHVTLSTKSVEGGSNPRTHEVLMTGGHPNSTTKAHELYHHLITKHDKVITTNSQTPGGFKIWQRLAQKPGVHVQGWDPHTRKTIPLKNNLKNDKETHADEHDTYGGKASEAVKRRARMHLMVVKKHD